MCIDRIFFLLLIFTCSTLAAADQIDFASQIQPILARRCYSCHGPDVQEAGLRFDQRESLVQSLDSGQTAIVPGQAADSELLHRITSTDQAKRMPPEGKPLSGQETELLSAWIDQGAVYSSHWAFQPISRPQIPSVNQFNQANQPLDMWIFGRLEKAGLAWVSPADPAILVRRAYLDVIGLPPTPEELTAWIQDWDQTTYERLIEKLLASPAFGQRWARMWLDVVRYAESNSYERDNPKPNAWRFRDYVIQSFNDDKPFSQFVREQIAGDELDHVTTETLTATGYYRLGLWDDEPADPLQARFDEYDDIVSTTGQAFLGLTINCARCHDHKIDPLTQRDYYSLLAFFRDVTTYATRSDQTTNNQINIDPDIAEQHKEIDSEIRSLQRSLRKLEQEAITQMPAADQRATEGDQREQVLKDKLQQYMSQEVWQEYSETKAELQKSIQHKQALPERVTTLGLAKLEAQPPATYILHRGSPHSEGDLVEPAFPGLMEGGLPRLPEVQPEARSAGRRRVLADWLADDDNWLTARVIVNRLWLHYFGRGIVRSPNNFGLMGDPPTHPEVLDYLACELIASGWSLKHIHRQILLSATYRRSSHNHLESANADPNNNLFWRQNIKRLSAEQLRDCVLHISGQFNDMHSGPPIYPTLSAEVLASQSEPGKNWSNSSQADQARRSIYIHVKRSLPVPLLSVFDFPDTDTSCEARFLTIQPGQALTLLNSQWMQEQSESLAQRVRLEAGPDWHLQAARCLELVQSYPADAQEIAELAALAIRLQHQEGLSADLARRYMALTSLNLNHFIYID